jgi:multiple antibiotic resistance protein
VFLILTLSALLGVRVLNAFGISLDVFSVAGGGVLLWMGFSMLRGVVAPTGGSSPLTSLVLFAASPGTITGVISIAVVHSRNELPLTALVAVAAATLLTWLVMVVVPAKKPNPAGGGFMQATVQSFMGLIVMAMGLQIGLKGLDAYFHLAGT